MNYASFLLNAFSVHTDTSDFGCLMQNGVLGVDPDGLRARFDEIFQDRCVFVREVLQNAVQAVRILPANLRANGVITVTLDATHLRMTDTGVGMDSSEAQHAISRFFGSRWIAEPQGRRRGTGVEAMLRRLLEDDDDLDDDESLSSEQVAPGDIGRFGVGLTTCLMVADCFEVRTRHHGGGPASFHQLTVGHDGHLPTIQYQWSILSEELPHGTCVSVPLSRLRKGRGECFEETFLRERILHYFALCDVPILLNGRLVCGGEPDPMVIPELFREQTHEAQKAGGFFVNIARRSPDGGYLRARVGLPQDRENGQTVDVFCRGIKVGSLPASEVVGDELSMITGVIDSDMFDLQLDRNRLSRDAQSKRFESTFRKWFCDELAQASHRLWGPFSQLFDLHREALLKLLYQDADATRILDPRAPFPSAAEPATLQPFEFYLDRAQTAMNGSLTLPFMSNRSRDHAAVAILAEKKIPVPVFATEIPSVKGRANLDLLFAIDHLMMTERRIRPVRADALLEEIAQMCPAEASAQDRAMFDAIAHRYQHLFRLALADMPRLELPILVGVPHRQAHDEELPGNSVPDWTLDSGLDEAEVARMALESLLSSLVTQSPSQKTMDRVKEKLEERFNRTDQRPVVILNLGHPLYRRTEAPADRRIGGIEAVILGRLLRAGTGRQDELLVRLETLILELSRPG